MKLHRTSHPIAVLPFLFSAAIASAQVSVGVSAPTNPVGSIGGSFGGSGSAAGALPGTSFGGSGAGAGSSSATFGAPDLSSGARVDAFESIGMRQARLAQQSTGTLAAASETETNVVPLPADEAASAALSAGFSAQTIHEAKPEERELLFTQVNKRMETSGAALATLKRDSKSLSGEAKSEFKAAAKEIEAREDALKASVKAARKASADTWPVKRAELAARYEAYAEAVARAETLAAQAQSANAAGASSAASTGVAARAQKPTNP